jgi:integrase/recombinase XerD
MLITYRRHNPAKCRLKSRSDYRCKCPIWVSGTLPSGERVRKALKGRDWNRAQDLVRRWEVDGAEPTKRSRVTIEECREKFMQDARSQSLSYETTRKYEHLFKQLEAFAKLKGIRFVDELDLSTLDDFRSSWKDAALSASKKLERMRSVFKFALARKWVSENPALHLKGPKLKPNPTLPFSTDEMEAILKAVENDSRLRAFILTMRFSGLRISDVTALTCDSLKGNKLQLYQAKTKEPVSILLPDFVADTLRAVPHSNPKYFFWSGHSKLTSTVGGWHRHLAEVFKTAKIGDGHSHRFRDTFAVALLTAGVAVEGVSTLLGHQNIKITQKHYSPWVKSRQDALDEEIRKANSLYKNGTK